MVDESSLVSTREFWDSNPCGFHGDYEARRAQRYAMEPWVPSYLERIAQNHERVLEVGCGQGVDSIKLCSILRPSASYIGIDYSPESVNQARQTSIELSNQLTVKPIYKVGNAEALEFPDNSFDAVYSMGVIHHTADEHRAIREIWRVLKPGGVAYIVLYRKWAPKVLAAKILRAVQRVFDAVLGTDRIIYKTLLKHQSSSRLYGTMYHECFGVPFMKWYTRADISKLFKDFSTVEISSVGPNLGRYSPSNSKGIDAHRFGYFWRIEAVKP